MKTNKIGKLLLIGVSVVALSGIAGWKAIAQPSADTHAHEENEAEEGHADEHGHDDHGEEGGHEEESFIQLDQNQLKAMGIETLAVGAGQVSGEISVPGKIVAAADRMAQIVPKVSGIVTRVDKNIGSTVEKGEVLGVIESREMADAAAEFFAASKSEDLARIMFKREKGLWDKKITAEQDYLTAKNMHQEAQIRLELAKQKLQALGYEGNVPDRQNARFYQLKSPIAGRVISREMVMGEYVDSTHTAFTIADLSTVWVETAISPNDLRSLKEGQSAHIAAGNLNSIGKLIFVSPVIDPVTRTAKAIIELENADGKWRSGEFVNASVAMSNQTANLIIPAEAIQTIGGQSTVFVLSEKGFKKHPVRLGRKDSRNVEVVSGLENGDVIAISNSFVLKAEFGKAEAEHSH